jgi:hypothetical protein
MKNSLLVLYLATFLLSCRSGEDGNAAVDVTRNFSLKADVISLTVITSDNTDKSKGIVTSNTYAPPNVIAKVTMFPNFSLLHTVNSEDQIIKNNRIEAGSLKLENIEYGALVRELDFGFNQD